MDWALDIDGSGIWIHVELAVGDLLRYVEKKFSGTFMVDSMTAAWQRSNVEESTVLFSVGPQSRLHNSGQSNIRVF